MMTGQYYYYLHANIFTKNTVTQKRSNKCIKGHFFLGDKLPTFCWFHFFYLIYQVSIPGNAGLEFQ